MRSSCRQMRLWLHQGPWSLSPSLYICCTLSGWHSIYQVLRGLLSQLARSSYCHQVGGMRVLRTQMHATHQMSNVYCRPFLDGMCLVSEIESSAALVLAAAYTTAECLDCT